MGRLIRWRAWYSHWSQQAHCLGVTNTGVDIQDLFVMKERGAGAQYVWKGKWTNYDTRTETIHVKGEPDPVELVIRSGKAGVIITDDEDVAETLECHESFSTRMAGR